MKPISPPDSPRYLPHEPALHPGRIRPPARRGKSYVIKLKEHGRLVMSADGKLVDIEASKARIAATADPASRMYRPSGSPGPGGSGRRRNRHAQLSGCPRRKERYAAKMAKLEYEKAIGKLVDKADVQAVVEDVITQFQQGLENLPYRLASELVGQDLDGIRAALKQEVFDSLAKMQRRFVRQMEEIGKQEA